MSPLPSSTYSILYINANDLHEISHITQCCCSPPPKSQFQSAPKVLHLFMTQTPMVLDTFRLSYKYTLTNRFTKSPPKSQFRSASKVPHLFMIQIPMVFDTFHSSYNSTLTKRFIKSPPKSQFRSPSGVLHESFKWF